jgi:hypothetical protein
MEKHEACPRCGAFHDLEETPTDCSTDHCNKHVMEGGTLRAEDSVPVEPSEEQPKDEAQEYAENLGRRYHEFQTHQAKRHMEGKKVIPGGVLVFNSLVILEDAIKEFVNHLSQTLKILPQFIQITTRPGKLAGTLDPDVNIGVPPTFFHRIRAEHPGQDLTPEQLRSMVDTRVQLSIKACGAVFKANYTDRMTAYFGTAGIVLVGANDHPRA